jgi:hypothetical protein
MRFKYLLLHLYFLAISVPGVFAETIVEKSFDLLREKPPQCSEQFDFVVCRRPSALGTR